MALYDVKNLSFKYNQSDVPTFENVNFSVDGGDFILLAGENGSGKSTLLRLLKKNITSYGKYEGDILFDGKNLINLDDLSASKDIGYLCQNIDEQIVTDKVYHELAFPLENFGIPSDKIKIRLAEIAAFFNIENLFFRDIKSLSGGQKQLVNIASIMTLNPRVILLDEPTSQLDPLARQEFIDYLDKINKNYNVSIIIIEHNIDEVIHLCNKIMFMTKGGIKYYDETKNVLSLLSKNESEREFLPSITKLFAYNNIDFFPIDIREGKKYIEEHKVSLKKFEKRVLNVNFNSYENAKTENKNIVDQNIDKKMIVRAKMI